MCEISSYSAPNSKEIGGVYLDKNYEIFMTIDNATTASPGPIYEFCALCDGAAVHVAQLLNILLGFPIRLPILLEVVDCSGHL